MANKKKSSIAAVIQTSLMVFWLLAAGVSICIPFLSRFVLDRGVVSREASEKMSVELNDDDKRILRPFLLLAEQTSSYTSTTSKVFIDAVSLFADSLNGFGIHLVDALDARFFASKNSGVVLFRQSQEIPAQVIKPVPLPIEAMHKEK